jgi:hypothetical protein
MYNFCEIEGAFYLRPGPHAGNRSNYFGQYASDLTLNRSGKVPLTLAVTRLDPFAGTSHYNTRCSLSWVILPAGTSCCFAADFGFLIAVLAGIVSSVLPQIFSYENTLPKSNFRGILWLSRQTSNKLEGCNYAWMLLYENGNHKLSWYEKGKNYLEVGRWHDFRLWRRLLQLHIIGESYRSDKWFRCHTHHKS